MSFKKCVKLSEIIRRKLRQHIAKTVLNKKAMMY